MEYSSKKHHDLTYGTRAFFSCILTVACFTLGVCGGITLFLRSAYDISARFGILSDDGGSGALTNSLLQLKKAVISVPFWIPIIGGLLVFAMCVVWHNVYFRRKRLGLWLLPVLVLAVVVFTAAVFFVAFMITRINGVQIRYVFPIVQRVVRNGLL